VRRLCLSRRSSLHHEASSIEYVVFDWLVYYVLTLQRGHVTVASLDTRHWIPERYLAEVPSLGSLARRFLEAASFRFPHIMCWIGIALLLPELRPQVCYPIRRGLSSVTPNGDTGAFLGLGWRLERSRLMLMMIPIRCIFSQTVGSPCQLWSLLWLDLLLWSWCWLKFVWGPSVSILFWFVCSMNDVDRLFSGTASVIRSRLRFLR